MKVFGLTVTLAVSGSLALVKFVYGPWIASEAVETIAEAYGTDLEVGSWTFDLHDLTLSAEELTISIPRGSYSRAEVFLARGVDFDLSAARLLATHDLAKSIRQIVVHDAQLFVERRLDGGLNLRGIANRPLLANDLYQLATRLGPGPSPDPIFQIAEIRVNGGSLSWSQEMPGPWMEGLSTRSVATLNVDDVQLAVWDVQGWVDQRMRASSFELSGRVANGRVQASGNGNFFAWTPATPAPVDLAKESDSGGFAGSFGQDRLPRVGARFSTDRDRPPIDWAPSLAAKVFLERVSPSMFAELVPDLALKPVRGNLAAEIHIELDASHVQADARMQLDGVAFETGNSKALLGQEERVRKKLENYRADGTVVVRTEGDLKDENYSVMASLQKETIQASTQDADPLVKQVAARDVKLQDLLVEGGVELVENHVAAELQSLVSKGLSTKTTEALTKTLGSGVSKALGSVMPTSEEPSQEAGKPNMIQRGAGAVGNTAKKVWGGFRGLLGGKSSQEKAESP